MTTKNYLQTHTASLVGKTVAITGSTGGLGRVWVEHLARLGASLILLDRNRDRSEALRDTLIATYGVDVRCIRVDLEDMTTVREATAALSALSLDIFVHNAGAYKIKRHLCESGFDNVFQINFAAPYYMIRELLPTLRARGGHVVAVGSIAHNYSRIDPSDIDFSTRRAASKVYGNAKRHLMFALLELFRGEETVTLSIVHPGITLTNMTAHFPKPIFAIIKYPMKLLFMSRERACLSLLRGVFEPCSSEEWIGPRVCNVWGLPKKQTLRTAKPTERQAIASRGEMVYAILARRCAPY